MVHYQGRSDLNLCRKLRDSSVGGREAVRSDGDPAGPQGRFYSLHTPGLHHVGQCGLCARENTSISCLLHDDWSVCCYNTHTHTHTHTHERTNAYVHTKTQNESRTEVTGKGALTYTKQLTVLVVTRTVVEGAGLSHMSVTEYFHLTLTTGELRRGRGRRRTSPFQEPGSDARAARCVPAHFCPSSDLHDGSVLSTFIFF